MPEKPIIMNQLQAQAHYSHSSNQYSEYSQPGKQRESELALKGQPERSICQPDQRLDPQQPYGMPRSNSQKAYPIIYNSFNQHRGQQDGSASHFKLQSNTQEMPKRYHLGNYLSSNHQPTNFQANHHHQPKQSLFEPTHSDVFLYGDNNQKSPRPEDHQRHQFVTFKHIPAEPQTANFLQLPSDRSDLAEQKHSFNPVKQATFVYRQQLNSSALNLLPREQDKSYAVNQNPQQIRPSNRIFTNNLPPPSPRNAQGSKHNLIAVSEQRARFVQIPQEEYQRYVEHMASCRGSQEEVATLKAKNQQLSTKERFNWEENNTLREENARLRDLVTHFQRREKELLRERQQLRTSLLENINKYQQSTLEEMGLLLERYRLQLQKKK